MKEDNINKNNSSIETQIIDYLKNFNPLKMNQFENQNEIVISNISVAPIGTSGQFKYKYNIGN